MNLWPLQMLLYFPSIRNWCHLVEQGEKRSASHDKSPRYVRVLRGVLCLPPGVCGRNAPLSVVCGQDDETGHFKDVARTVGYRCILAGVCHPGDWDEQWLVPGTGYGNIEDRMHGVPSFDANDDRKPNSIVVFQR